jgi:hypothetical protein
MLKLFLSPYFFQPEAISSQQLDPTKELMLDMSVVQQVYNYVSTLLLASMMHNHTRVP